MGIRETLQRSRPTVVAVTIAVVLVSCIYVIRELMAGNRPPLPTQAYYTTDDGATFFTDDNTRIPPFDYGGKQAVKAQVYRCGETKFVGYLIRYTPDAQKQLAAANGVGVGALMAAGTELKKPLTGDTGWVNSNDRRAGKVYDIKCPGKSGDAPEVVLP